MWHQVSKCVWKEVSRKFGTFCSIATCCYWESKFYREISNCSVLQPYSVLFCEGLGLLDVSSKCHKVLSTLNQEFRKSLSPNPKSEFQVNCLHQANKAWDLILGPKPWNVHALLIDQHMCRDSGPSSLPGASLCASTSLSAGQWVCGLRAVNILERKPCLLSRWMVAGAGRGAHPQWGLKT